MTATRVENVEDRTITRVLPARNTQIIRMEANHKKIIDFLSKTFENLGLLSHLNDPKTVELLINPDCRPFVEKLGSGMQKLWKIDSNIDEFIDPKITEQIIIHAAKFQNLNTEIRDANLIVECEFPLDGSRFAGQLPPAVANPSIAIRKKASEIFPLNSYVKNGIISVQQRQEIEDALLNHKNIIVAGGTGSGKTTLTNALIDSVVRMYPEERFIIIEDTGEIQCNAENYVQYHTTQHISMTTLIRTALRMRPDRILVGEVRGPEALDLLDGWNTGHPGGICTLHSNTAATALTRLRMMLTRNDACPADVQLLIGEAVDLVIYIERKNGLRRVSDMIAVDGYDEVKKRYFIRHIQDLRTENQKLEEELSNV